MPIATKATAKRKDAESIKVEVGQVWKDCDPRATRHFKVMALEVGAPYTYDRAVVRACLPDGTPCTTPSSRIRLDRLRKSGSRGYALVR